MGLLSYIRSAYEGDGSDYALLQEVEKHIELCSSCDACSPEWEAEVARDTQVFARLKIEREAPLFGTSKPASVHFVVPTSQMDWAHSACDERPGSVQQRVAAWAAKQDAGPDDLPMRCSVSSQPIDILDVDVMRGRKNNVLILPHFVKLVGLTADRVEQVLDEILPLLRANDMAGLLARPDIWECPEDSFVFLCSHTTRDKRCGITAPVLRKHICAHLQTHGLYRDVSDARPHGCTVAFVNHVGGHKYSANALIFLKRSRTMLWLARVSPIHAEPIVKHLLVPAAPQLPFPENVRCVRKYDF
ncbi:AaceriAER040Cp [[Ashbya] aceris (nom. inval.)]|nr:AaceriAER040Cp [[Ashbya] aceris (nom. inval.)]